MSRIIAISGISGAGKSTLARALAERYDSSSLCWDDFDAVSSHPSDYLEWHHSGRDYARWNYPALEIVLRKLRDGEIGDHPVSGKSLPPTPLVFFDAPLGRLHKQTARWIDLACHLSIPADIALCRRLVRDYEKEADGQPAAVEDVLEELRFYAEEGSKLFDDGDLVRTTDLILDGLLSTARQLEAMDRHLRDRGYI